jgi:hypothetical protein
MTIPPGNSILLVGIDGEAILSRLSPSKGVIINWENEPTGEPFFEHYHAEEIGELKGKFDYIILHHGLAFCQDIGTFVIGLADFCNPDTRLIVCCHNYLWKPILKILEKLGLKRKGGLDVMLSGTDIHNLLSAAGFQMVTSTRWILMPVNLLGIGLVINTLGKILPFFDWIKVNLFQLYRRWPAVKEAPEETLTVCLTCRDEKENIEPIVQRIPQVAEEQEILFVEGHSSDGTLEEIRRVMSAYPEKNIRVIGQPGKGQGDAIREGFTAARGSIIILLEADMTSPPENIHYVYESMQRRHLEFIQGSRFIYPLSGESMPYFNQIGNWGFSFFFSWLFWRQITDVLSGIKAIRKKDFEKILLFWNSWGIDDPFGDFELLFGAMRLGLKTGEMPIRYLPRSYGQTKTRPVFHGYLLFRMAMNALFRFRG